MPSNDYSITTVTPWDTWDSTRYAHGDFHFACDSESFGAYRSSHVIESKYPGFVSAYTMLTAVGCDEYFVTRVLKFCITSVKAEDLDAFLVSSAILDQVQTAVSIGLSGDEFITILTNSNAVTQAVSLPIDLSVHT